jgi:hypothetical protein
MHVISTMSAIADHLLAFLICVFLSVVIGLGISYALLRKYFSGLFYVQISFVFNTAIILFGWWLGIVSLVRVVHYFFYEIFTVIGVYWVYRWILQDKAVLCQGLRNLKGKVLPVLVVVYEAVLCGIVIKCVVGANGASRIAYMEGPWFSFFRPVMSILDPLSCLYMIRLFDQGKRVIPFTILGLLILSCVLSGSKASFLFSILFSLFLYQDLKGARLAMSRSFKGVLIVLLFLSTAVTLSRLNVSASDMAARFVETGESTIEVYYSYNPNAAAANVSTFAKIHRGVAKILGDRSAADPDTQFGFALNTIEYGVNTFTGPNAQIASYMMCNYKGSENLIGVVSIIGYLVTVMLFYRVVIRKRMEHGVGISLLPFLVTSLYTFPQDYNHGMSSVTAICIFSAVILWVSLAIRVCGGERILYDRV